jgi:diguanylate cyclase (GGDEF)-like protein
LRSLCASPLVTENKVLGVVRVNSSRAGTFNADDLRLLDVISGLGAVTLRNLLLYAKMEELAIRDSLTGLYVNRYFQERLAEEISRAFLDKTSFSLILLDIDYFKKYNDEYGHSAGDLVLRNISTLISHCVEPSDIVARYGGEEFIVLLPNRKKKEAALFAEKIRSEIEKNRFMLRRAEGRVTASLGVATFPDEGRTKEEIIWAVDKKMYKAKSQGRNQVVSR